MHHWPRKQKKAHDRVYHRSVYLSTEAPPRHRYQLTQNSCGSARLRFLLLPFTSMIHYGGVHNANLLGVILQPNGPPPFLSRLRFMNCNLLGLFDQAVIGSQASK